MHKIVKCKLQIANCKLVGWHGHASVAMPPCKFTIKPRPSVAPHVKLRPLVALMAALLLFAVGCGDISKDPQPSSPQKNPARSEVERGPVKLTAEVQPAKARLSDEPVLTLTIDYEPGVQVEKPPFGASMGSFLVRDFHEPLTKTRNGREIMQQVYTLEPIETGRLLIDPINVTFIDLRPNGDEKTHTLQTEALSVEISSMLGDSSASLADLRPQAGPLDLPAHWSVLGWSIVIICILFAIIGWLTRRHFKRKQAAAEVVLSPEELARMELEKLAQSRLAETDLVQFYVELTAVVRRYIERTTGVRAPEQTTEEFLREISQANTFDRDTNERLRNFLESADLVKFAAYRPRQEDVEESFSRAKIFIGLKPQGTTRQAQEAAV